MTRRATEDLRLEFGGAWPVAWFPLEREVRIDDGLSLGECNALALFYSPSIRAARDDAHVAAAQVLQAGVLANPELFLGPRISARDSNVIFPSSIGWELPLWGVGDAEREVAGTRLTERQLEVVEAELAVLERVRESFLRLGRLRREEAILAAVSASSREIVDWVEALARAGEADAVAVYLARAENDDASAALEAVRADAARARRELLALLGLLPAARVTLVVDATTETLPELPEADSDALLGVPALRAAAAAYASAEAELRLQLGEQYPAIRIGPEFEDDRGDPTFGFGLGITLPVFDRNQGGIAAAAESRQRAREHFSAALLRASHAEAAARADLEAAERLLQMHREGALRDAERASGALDVRLRVGRQDVVEVLAVQRAMARGRVRELELQERVAVARLRAAVAGGLALQRPAADGEAMEK